MTTTIYKFHPEYFYYTGEKEARLDPIERKPILPGKKHSSMTTVEPPAIKVGFARVFDREADTWSYVEDPLGYSIGKVGKEPVYSKVDGSPVHLSLGKKIYPKLGPLPEGYTLKECPTQDHEWDEASDAWVLNETKKAEREAEEARVAELRLSTFITEFEDIVRGKSLQKLNTLANTAFDGLNPGLQKFLKYQLAKVALEVQ